MKKLLTVLSVFCLCSSVSASELTFEFGSPSFSGNGKSSHYLTIENIEKTRKDAIKAADKAAKEKAESEAKNTAIAKFKANIEARFYTALANKLQTTYLVQMGYNKTLVHLHHLLVVKLLNGQHHQVQVT